uniref:Uncharacterized protein n=1 Tax=Corvus moneduloides TaxID=1196302 RepID=A0A8U7NVE2_CORMO
GRGTHRSFWVKCQICLFPQRWWCCFGVCEQGGLLLWQEAGNCLHSPPSLLWCPFPTPGSQCPATHAPGLLVRLVMGAQRLRDELGFTQGFPVWLC